MRYKESTGGMGRERTAGERGKGRVRKVGGMRSSGGERRWPPPAEKHTSL